MAGQKRTYKVLDWKGYEVEEVTCISSDDAYWDGRGAGGHVWYEFGEDGSYSKSGGYILVRGSAGAHFFRIDDSEVMSDYYAPVR